MKTKNESRFNVEIKDGKIVIDLHEVKDFTIRTNKPFYILAWMSWYSCIPIHKELTFVKAQEWLTNLKSSL